MIEDCFVGFEFVFVENSAVVILTIELFIYDYYSILNFFTSQNMGI